MRLTLSDVNFFEATASKLNRRLASKSLLVPDLGLAQLISAGWGVCFCFGARAIQVCSDHADWFETVLVSLLEFEQALHVLAAGRHLLFENGLFVDWTSSSWAVLTTFLLFQSIIHDVDDRWKFPLVVWLNNFLIFYFASKSERSLNISKFLFFWIYVLLSFLKLLDLRVGNVSKHIPQTLISLRYSFFIFVVLWRLLSFSFVSFFFDVVNSRREKDRRTVKKLVFTMFNGLGELLITIVVVVEHGFQYIVALALPLWLYQKALTLVRQEYFWAGICLSFWCMHDFLVID